MLTVYGQLPSGKRAIRDVKYLKQVVRPPNQLDIPVTDFSKTAPHILQPALCGRARLLTARAIAH